MTDPEEDERSADEQSARDFTRRLFSHTDEETGQFPTRKGPTTTTEGAA